MWVFEFRDIQYIVPGDNYDEAVRNVEITFRGAVDEVKFIRKLQWHDYAIYRLTP